MDPPEHSTLRAHVGGVLAAHRAKEWAPLIERTVGELIDAMAGRSRIDGMDELAIPLALRVGCAVVGVPRADEGLVRRWQDDMLLPIVDEQSMATVNQAMRSTGRYLHGIIDYRRRNPGPDLLTALIRDHDEGRLDMDELVKLAAMVLSAGLEAPAAIIGATLAAIALQPNLFDELRADPSLIPGAVDEVVRDSGPVEELARYSAEPINIGDVRIPGGQPIVLCIGTANHDPSRFPDPDVLQVDRPNNQHFGYGWGPHYCPGAPLGRLQAHIAIEAVLTRLNRFVMPVPLERLKYRNSSVAHSLLELPLDFVPDGNGASGLSTDQGVSTR
jgi:cytochrome P450